MSDARCSRLTLLKMDESTNVFLAVSRGICVGPVEHLDAHCSKSTSSTSCICHQSTWATFLVRTNTPRHTSWTFQEHHCVHGQCMWTTWLLCSEMTGSKRNLVSAHWWSFIKKKSNAIGTPAQQNSGSQQLAIEFFFCSAKPPSLSILNVFKCKCLIIMSRSFDTPRCQSFDHWECKHRGRASWQH